jgi:2-polyprenyl-3-methyl-5-hydroxy-6-metoxy-1,4-benzoquinol methylase
MKSTRTPRVKKDPFGSELRYLPDFGPIERAAIRLYGTLSGPTVTRFTRFKHFALPYFDREGFRAETILDYGCAFGAFGFELARRDPNVRVFLYDASPAAAEKCRTIALRGGYANVTVLDEEALARANGFSLVLLISVLEHVPDDLALLERLRDALSPHGLLFVMTPEASAHQHCTEKDGYLGHVRPGYTRKALLELLERAGYEVVAEPSYSAREPPGPIRVLRDAYTFLARSPGHPLLDFGSLPRLPLWRKAALALLWPVYRVALEVDGARAGMRGDRVAAIARRRTAGA